MNNPLTIIDITICIGSSCHLKGSRKVVEQLQSLVAENNLAGKVQLNGTFCTGNCTKGVCVKIGEELFSVQPETTGTFFKNEILGRLSADGKGK
jgi:NADH:ubiquinone oxidoreductase subunit E